MLVSGLRCHEHSLQALSLPKQKSSVRQILGVQELDDDGFDAYGSIRENTVSSPRFSQRLVAVNWPNAAGAKQWSMHVLKRGIVEQDILYFDGVVAVPTAWVRPEGVQAYIGLWFGHLSIHWSNWNGPTETLERQCNKKVFHFSHPQRIADHLGDGLSLIDGGAGTLKTTKGRCAASTDLC